MSNFGVKVGALLMALMFLLILGYSFAPGFRAAINLELAAVQKADDATRYATTKKVEDTCRAMIASYNADKLTFEQYNGNSDPEKQGWADSAQMRANRTAATYNEYILKNSYVWENNVPEDINTNLAYVGKEEDTP